ncbi:glycosyltransferase [Mycolicibacterium novocastrense]|uniref:Glycosyltransferase n=1 Tax=Mycolicibacterium novocastrense TaxID=59813 RepID=A0AAW5STH4_MYCNV|nr:glycosyltransferase family 4 protein [Mycolicibacterium novocastrense]MCV7026347.1 glycosyltransferase [Mycolicibacterium novocastrense]GAT11183.1 group 1 glycosyl transferase [Mycolicibacterium novocastrense]
MPKSVALISAVDPYPTDAGKKVVLAGFVDYLSERIGAHQMYYVMVGGGECGRFPVTLRGVEKPRGREAMVSLFTRTLTGRCSMQEALLNTPDLRAAIHRTLQDIKPDLEIYDTVRMAQHAPDTNRRAVCYLDDLFSERYRRMLDAAQRYQDVDLHAIGNFAVHVPKALRPSASWQPSQRALLRLEQRLVRRSEDRVAHRFDTTLLINEQEAALLRTRAGVDGARIHGIPPLLSDRPAPVRNYRGAPEFVFLGQLSLTHNDDGLRHFLTAIWPLVLEQRPDARLTVIGRDPLPNLIEVAAQYPHSVTLEGYVPELASILSRSAALVNPLRFGSGVKLKIIEALGAAIPVISTSIGAEGVAVGADHGVLVADSAPDFAQLMLEATDTRDNADLSAAARQHFDSTYSRRAVFARYDTVFGLG